MPTSVHSVQRVVKASPAVVFDMLAHPARHCEFDGSDTVRSAVSGPERLSLGDEFSMSMKSVLGYTSTSQVVEFEEGRRIAWQTGLRRGDKFLLGGQIWRYELTDRGDGSTLVRESYDLGKARPAAVLARTAGPKMVENMRKTLDRMAQLFRG